MKRTIGLILASGLVLLLAGCSSMSSRGTTAATEKTAASTAALPMAQQPVRNFNLAVKCPGVYYEKTHGWTDAQIAQQEALDEEDIPICVKYVEAQPKGYVPPPPPGYVPKKAPVKAMPMAPQTTSPKAGTTTSTNGSATH